jgi:hypothetical protein
MTIDACSAFRHLSIGNWVGKGGFKSRLHRRDVTSKLRRNLFQFQVDPPKILIKGAKDPMIQRIKHAKHGIQY